MYFWIVIKVALKSLIANKLRSFLAMLGIIIGVSAVIAMLSIASGAQKQILQDVSAMGTNLLIVRPGQGRTGGVASGEQQNLRIDEAKAILQSSFLIKAVAPVVSGNFQVKYMNKNSRTNVMGTSFTYFSIRNVEVEKGRKFEVNESEGLARVAIIGPTTAKNLFGLNDPLDETIKVKGINFTVIGVLKSKGDQGFFNPDDQVIVPYKVAMKQLLGVDYLREIDISVVEGGDLNKVQEICTKELRKLHRLLPEQEDDFNVRNQAEILETVSKITQTFTILLGGIGSISLLVGGIGIMNIMLVTVTERTREIGVRKAIGAKERDILRQFLIEAIVMTTLGGLFGLLLGLLFAKLISNFSEIKAIVTLQSVFISISFSVAVGIFFGYYPAKRAAKLDPIESLRYE